MIGSMKTLLKTAMNHRQGLRPSRARGRSRRPDLERLDGRVLMAANVSLYGSMIAITGTESADTCRVDFVPGSTLIGGSYRVTVAGDGQTQKFSFPSVSATWIGFMGNGGNDRFENNTHLTSKALGGFGDDTLIGGSGFDLFYGDSGRDNLQGRGGVDHLYGGTGTPIFSGPGGEITDYVHPTEDDTLDGGDGDDLLLGEEGHDTLIGGRGDDSLDGGDQNDALYGDSGEDTLYGGCGADFLDGGDQDDTLCGGSNVDELHGGSGNDSLYGNSGNDRLFGESGNDFLDGDEGEDNLDGGTGEDRLIGGDGDDTINSIDNDNDYVDGGDGIDTILLNAFAFNKARGRYVYDLTADDADDLVIWS